jgi:DNA polymerase-3 subunit delta'
LGVTLVPLYGHESIQQRLASAAEREALPASLLFHGPQGIGKQRLALWLAQFLLCRVPGRPCGRCQDCRYSMALVHPDLRWIFPRPRLRDSDPSADDVAADYAAAIAERVANGGLYPPPSGADAIFVVTTRALLQVAAMAPAISTRKVFVIGDAERMVPQEGAEAAANAFLKLLEEPPADTTIILTSSVPGSLLPTIRSRVAAIRIAPLPDDVVHRFVLDPIVREALTDTGLENTERAVKLASGAPGLLLGRTEAAAAAERARRILAAALARDRRADRLALALGAGAAKARSSFTETLDGAA